MTLTLRSILKSFRNRRVLDDVSLSVKQGSMHALLGVNGSGKSTLFRICAGLDSADAGSISIHKQSNRVPLDNLTPTGRVTAGLRYIGQNRRVVEGLTGFEHLKVALGSASSIQVSRSIDCWAEIGLLHLLDQSASSMSAAQRALLLLGICYALQPRFALVDEPFSGMDDADCALGAEILRRLSQSGTGVLVTDHNARRLMHLVDTVSILKDGQLQFSESAEAARTSQTAKALYFGNSLG